MVSFFFSQQHNKYKDIVRTTFNKNTLTFKAQANTPLRLLVRTSLAGTAAQFLTLFAAVVGFCLQTYFFRISASTPIPISAMLDGSGIGTVPYAPVECLDDVPSVKEKLPSARM